MPLAVAARSAVERYGGKLPLAIYVLSCGFSGDLKVKVAASLPEGSAQIHWVPIDVTAFQSFSTLPYISKMTYARLQIQDVLPASLSRILYLDADLLVLDDLSPLLEMDLEGHVLAAALDGLDLKVKNNKPGLERVPRVQNYFNAGVLLIDLGRWREMRISERSLDYLKQNPSSPFSDQDALNVACDGVWKKLDWRWNFQDPGHHRIVDLPPAQRPAILHFFTSVKPWNPRTQNVNAGFYDSFRNRTAFARNRQQKMHDELLGLWCACKGVLRRSATLCSIKDRLEARLNQKTVSRQMHIGPRADRTTEVDLARNVGAAQAKSNVN